MIYRESYIRHWDPNEEYVGAELRLYPHWAVEVSWQQHTLGCFIIFCRREGVRLQSELNAEESTELTAVMRQIEGGMRKSGHFDPSHFNYLQMGNLLPLLHFHGIPRYRENRPLTQKLFAREITDSTPNDLPPWSRERITSEQMEVLWEFMNDAIGRQCGIVGAARENPFYKGLRKAMEIP